VIVPDLGQFVNTVIAESAGDFDRLRRL